MTAGQPPAGRPIVLRNVEFEVDYFEFGVTTGQSDSDIDICNVLAGLAASIREGDNPAATVRSAVDILQFSDDNAAAEDLRWFATELLSNLDRVERELGGTRRP